MVFNTEGYAVGKAHIAQLTKILQANQIIAEHRYFGESVPDSMDWKYLNIREAAADHHRITGILKKYYPGKWITMGISKGGQTAMYHRRFYPGDADATVCYVAPLNFSYREPRIAEFLNRVGDADCRERIFTFQRRLLERKAELLPRFSSYGASKDYTFSIGPETAYEFCVLEVPFAFWQWQALRCEDLRADMPADTLFDKFVKIVSPYYFSDQGIAYYTPFFHQALNEIGYYDYDLSPFGNLITAVRNPTYLFNAPAGTTPDFDPAIMHDIADWIRKEGRRMLFIYGGNDPWGASAVDLGDNTECLKMVLPGGSHATRIPDFTAEDQAKIYATLSQWLTIEIKQP
jgi:hypothetical protein